MNITLYEKASLRNLRDVNQGEIIEAIPGSRATTPYKGKPSSKSPSSIFGYVFGISKVNTPLCSIGDTLIQRIISPDVITEFIPLTYWGLAKKEVYLVLGKVEDIDNRDISQNTRIMKLFNPGFKMLNSQGISSLRDRLIEHISKRGKRDYFFKTPDKKKYSLKDILLSLEEIK